MTKYSVERFKLIYSFGYFAVVPPDFSVQELLTCKL